MGASKQVVRPPQRGIFPLDHFGECQAPMQAYIECLQANQETHHKCRDQSKDYLECRMSKGLMSQENLEQMGYSEEQKVVDAKVYDKKKEKEGFVAGKHIEGKSQWWWQKSKKEWDV
jgi:cytochrome c oxidase assembly protein subunit 19